jgi:hypothetical protein
MTTLPTLCADRLEILAASTSWSPNSLLSLEKGKLYLYLVVVWLGDSNVLDVGLCCQVPLTQIQNVTSQNKKIS